MIIKVNPSGCSERKGMVKVRIDMFLEPGEARYDERYYQWPVGPGEPGYIPYDGRVDELGSPQDKKKYQEWWDSLPLVWRHAPFHVHFMWAEPSMTDDEILDKAEHFAENANKKWSNKERPHQWNIGVRLQKVVDSVRKAACNARVQILKANPPLRQKNKKNGSDRHRSRRIR